MSAQTSKPVHSDARKTSPNTARRLFLLSCVRRTVQLAVLALFIGTTRLGWTLAGEPLLSGDLSSSLFAGTVPLADPFALLQKLFAGHAPELTMIAGALLILGFYIIVGGRAFCAWVCPMNIVTDAAASMRAKLGIRSDWLRIHRNVRYGIAAGALIASCVTGAAAFEWISPQAFIWREAVWGIGMGFFAAVIGVFALDALLLQRGWCGHLCPLGAFWSVVGNAGLIKPVFIDRRCTRCGDCLKVCPEPQVINFKQAAACGIIASGECTSCGKCAAVCAENAIVFAPRFNARKLARTSQNCEQESTL